MMIDDEFPFENILNTFSNYNRTLQGSGGFPPNRSLFCLMLSTICSDYCDLPLGSYKKKSQEEPRQDLWSSRKKISIDHVAPQVGQKYQTMIEHMYTVLTWNTYSLSLSTVFQNNFARLELLLGYLSTSLSFVAANSILDRFRSELLLSYLYCSR